MDLFRGFFLQYALAHLIGGIVLWTMPSVFAFVVVGEVSPGAAALIGMLSIMVGCGFGAAAWADGTRARRTAIGWALVSNTVNAGGHLLNAATGRAPMHVAILVAVACGPIFVALAYLFVRERAHSDKPERS